MAKVPVYTMQGEQSGEVELPEQVFGIPMNKDLLYQAVRVGSLRRRRVLAHTKDRSEVRGGGRKPWRQKGTGRARHGSIRSPLWRGGGITFGPRKDRQYQFALPDAMRRRALAVVLSAKARDGEIAIVESFQLEAPKTKAMAQALARLSRSAFGVSSVKKFSSVLVVLAEDDLMVRRAARNLPYAHPVHAKTMDFIDLLKMRNLIVSKDALPIFIARVQPRKSRRQQHRS